MYSTITLNMGVPATQPTLKTGDKEKILHRKFRKDSDSYSEKKLRKYCQLLVVGKVILELALAE